jgi:hypothetical protein
MTTSQPANRPTDHGQGPPMYSMSTEEWHAFVTLGAPTDEAPPFAYVEARGEVTRQRVSMSGPRSSSASQ